MKRLRRWLKRLWRLLWRGSGHTLFSVILLLFLTWLALVLAASSVAGSRWLLERLAGLQGLVRYEVAGGTLRDGIRLSHFRFQARKFHIEARSLTLSLSWASLLRGEVYIDSLDADGVRLVFTGPPNPNPVKLKHLRIPFRLVVAHGILRHPSVVKATGTLEADSLSLVHGTWYHEDVRVGLVELAHRRFRLEARGGIRLDGAYPLQATGLAEADFLKSHALRPVRIEAGGDLGALDLRLRHERPVPLLAVLRINTLIPQQDYRGLVRWGKMEVPWYADVLGLTTREGLLHLRGNRKGMTLLGEGTLSGRQIPAADYRWYAETDWKGIRLMPLEARRFLGGSVSLHGEVRWKDGIGWRLDATAAGADLSRQWPVPSWVLPPLNGALHSEGAIAARGSRVKVEAELAGAERWRIDMASASWPWRFHETAQANLTWDNLPRRVPGLGEARSAQGQLRYQGTPNDYRLEADLALDTARLPAGRWRLGALGGPQRLNAETLQYQGEGGALSGTGAVHWRNGLLWSTTLDLDRVNSRHWLPDWPTEVSGQVSATGEALAGGVQEVSIRQAALQGHLRDEPLQLDGDLMLRLEPGRDRPFFRSESLVADWGRNHLEAAGGLWGGHWDLTLNSRLEQPGLLAPDFDGRLEGVVQLQGEEALPGLTLNLLGEGLKGPGFGAGMLSLSGHLPSLAHQNGFLQLHAKEPWRDDRRVGDLTLVAEGSRDAHRLSWQVDASPLQAEGVIEGGVVATDTGDLDWQGRSTASTFSLENANWRQEGGDLPLAWQALPQQLTVGARCWTDGEARICATDESRFSPAEAHARLSLEGLEIARFSPFFPEGLAWQGSLQGEGSLDWRKGSLPELAVTLNTYQGAIGLAQEEDEPITLPYSRLGLKMVTEGERIRTRFETEAPHIGQGYVETWLDPSAKPYTINGALLLEKVNLAIFKPFFPGMRQLSGEMNLSGGLSGALTGPDFYGDFSLTGGSLTARDTPVDLQQIRMDVAIRGKEARIDGDFLSGNGKAGLNGRAEWQGEPSLKLKLAGNGLEIRQKPLVQAVINPDLNLSVSPYRVDIGGKVEVTSGLLRPQALSDKAVPLSPDVRIIRDEDGKARARLARSMRQWDINADIELLLRDKVLFEGFGLHSALAGQLRLQQQKQRGLQATGEIDLRAGGDKEPRYEAYGQKLTIREGRLLFAGPVTQPALNIEAVKSVADKVVGVRVEGRANAPTVQLIADTPMTQDEMLGYLLVGRPLYQEGRLSVGGNSGNDTALLTSAALSLGIRSGQGIASDIGNLVGISDVALDAEGSGDDTSFTVSGYLSPRLYLRYGVGVFTPVSKVTLRYKINQSLYMEAVSSIENALDLYYNLKY